MEQQELRGRLKRLGASHMGRSRARGHAEQAAEAGEGAERTIRAREPQAPRSANRVRRQRGDR